MPTDSAATVISRRIDKVPSATSTKTPIAMPSMALRDPDRMTAANSTAVRIGSRRLETTGPALVDAKATTATTAKNMPKALGLSRNPTSRG